MKHRPPIDRESRTDEGGAAVERLPQGIGDRADISLGGTIEGGTVFVVEPVAPGLLKKSQGFQDLLDSFRFGDAANFQAHDDGIAVADNHRAAAHDGAHTARNQKSGDID